MHLLLRLGGEVPVSSECPGPQALWRFSGSQVHQQRLQFSVQEGVARYHASLLDPSTSPPSPPVIHLLAGSPRLWLLAARFRGQRISSSLALPEGVSPRQGASDQSAAVHETKVPYALLTPDTTETDT